MTKTRGILLAAMFAMLTAVGCGGKKNGNTGSSEGGVSLQQQYTQAVADGNPQSRANALARIGYNQHKAGDASGALTSFREAGKAIAEIENPFQRATSEALLASAYARSSGKSEAGKLLKSASANAEKVPSAENKIEAQCRIAIVYAVDLQEPGNATTKLQNAEKLADVIDNMNDRLSALGAIIRGYHKANKSADAERLIGKADELSAGIGEGRQKAEALVTISRVMVETNRKDEGLAKLNAATELAKQIPDAYGKVYVMTTLAEQYALAGDAGKSRSLLAEATTLTKSIPEADLRQEIQDRIRRISGR
jgi:hypothetical protein